MNQQKVNSDNEEQKPRLFFDGMALPPLKPFTINANDRFEAIRNLETREDDVILVAYPKAGTHWIWEMLCMLLQGHDDYVKECKESVFLEAIPDLEDLKELPSPRVLNTHAPYRWLPKQHTTNGRKIVHVVRNPKDIAVSMYYHWKASGEFFGFAIQSFSEFYSSSFDGPEKPYGGWFAFEKEFEKAERKETDGSIHTLHFESMKKNPENEIRRLSRFLNVDVSDKLMMSILNKCSFKKLKDADATMKDKSRLSAIYNLPSSVKVKQSLYRKGEIGDWKNHFTVALNEEFDRQYKEEMINSSINVQFE